MDKKSIPNDEMSFTINEVAKMIGVVPATIRNWEKHGLFTAKRSQNNYRIYNFDDIELLKKIKIYSLEENMGISSIKNILKSDLASITPITSTFYENKPKYSKKILSTKWKESREKLNYTLEEVSNYTGISTSYLSKIENGQANISFDMLNKLAIFYGQSILYFVDKDTNESKIVQKGQGERISVGMPGVTMESLVSVSQHIIYPMIFKIDPDCGSLETHRHHGEEFIYVLQGKLEVILNHTDIYVLKPGDSMYFKSFEYHSWRNIHKKETQLIWVHSPIES